MKISYATTHSSPEYKPEHKNFHHAAPLRIIWIIPQILGLTFPVKPYKAIISTLALWRHNWQSRKALQRLNPHLLHDIGFTEAMRDEECQKKFWQ